MRLRVDPWDPDYGASVELDPQLEQPTSLDYDVENDGPWAPVSAPAASVLPRCAFIDGVRRIDRRLVVEDGEVTAPGLAGSWAAGCARPGPPADISDVRLGRLIITGSGLEPAPLAARVGALSMSFTSVSVPGAGPLDPLRELQNAMRDAEESLAHDVLVRGEAELVVIDGPLSYGMSGCAVGMIKRQARVYLDSERSRVLAALDVGERTPIFRFGERRTERYSWYLRLTRPGPVESTSAGIVRLETAPGELDQIQRLAALSAATLPRFAPAPGWDAQAPQNLYPIAALESTLRHRLGDPMLVRRAFDVRLSEEVGAGG